VAFNQQSEASWPVDVLTTDYLISGEVEVPAQKWGWIYFCTTEQRIAQSLDLRVTANRSTAGLPTLGWDGARASFGFRSGLVAIIPRGPAAAAVWDQWNASLPGAPAVMLVGGYAITATVLTADGAPGTALLNHSFAARDASITRVDGRGDGTPITAERAIITTQFVQAITTAGP
jgi:hypothetical protein